MMNLKISKTKMRAKFLIFYLFLTYPIQIINYALLDLELKLNSLNLKGIK